MKLFGSLSELVSAVFRKNSQAITLRPNQATTYTGNRDIQTPPQDANSVLVSQDATQTLTNKTIAGASNTLTVRLASDVTGILPTANGGTGQNSTATFPTSGVVVTEAGTETLTNKTISGSSNTLTVLAGSQLSGQVPTANGGTGVNSTATFPTSGVIVTEAATETLTNKTLDNTNTVTLKDTLFTIQDDGDTSKQARFQASGITTATTRTFTFPDANTTIVGTDATQTLSNKTISGASNTLTVRAASDITGQLPTANGGTGQNSTATFPTSGVVVTEAATETLTNKTISGSSNTLTVLAGTQLSGQVPIANGGTGASTKAAGFDALSPMSASGDIIYGGTAGTGTRLAKGSDGNFLTLSSGLPVWSSPSGSQSASSDIKNHSITSSVAANALTVALKDQGGSDASAGSTVNIALRSSTAANGTWNVRSVTAALSLTVASGATLGHSSGVDQPIYVYALDNAGTVELAVSMNLFDDGVRQSTTALSGSSNTAGTLYSTTARSNVPIRLIGKLISNQTAAGTWAATPTNFESQQLDTPAKTIMGDQAAGTVGLGYLGEYLSATRTYTNRNTLTTGTDNTICSFNIEPGIWLISGAAGFDVAGTTTLNYLQACIINGGTSSAGFTDQYGNVNYSTMGTIAINNVYAGATVANTVPVFSFPMLYVRLTTTTTFNLVSQAGFGVSTCKGYGSMNAIRIA